MNNRIPLDDMTSDQLDELYERLNDAEKVIAHLEDGEKLRLRAENELAALRAVARGYCPACGRGDAAPTVADWEHERQRADRAEAEIAACRKQQWPQLAAHLAACLANTYELTIDDVLAEAHAAIEAKETARAAAQQANT